MLLTNAVPTILSLCSVIW